MRVLAVAFLLSGAAGLMYQVVWTRLLVLVFGSTTIAVSTVLTVFMGGLALGAWVIGSWVDRRSRALIVYIVLEVAVGLYAFLVPELLDLALPIYQSVWNGTASPRALLAVRFFFIALILMIPTTLMGATLPVMSRALAAGTGAIAGRVGHFYALNTAGAVAGAWLTGFVLLPVFGVTPTIRIAVACNLAAAAAVWWVARGEAARSRERAILARSGEERDGVGPPRLPAWIVATLGLSGAVALIDEVAWSRALGLILGSSVYAFTAMLTTFLIGLAGGAATGAWLGGRIRPGWRVVGGVQIAIAAAAIATVAALSQLPLALVVGARALESLGVWAIPFLQFGLSFLVIFVPTFGFGLVFPLALHAVAPDPRSVGGVVGRMYAINTLGAIVGAFLAGFVLVPAIGVQQSLFLAAGVSLTLGVGLVIADPAISRPQAVGWGLGLAAAAVLAAAVIPPWSSTLMSSGMYWNLPRYTALYDAEGSRGVAARLATARTLYQREGLTATVVVGRDSGGDRMLTINGRTESGDGFMRTQVLIAHWPLWLARSVDRVLVIGLGSGATAGSVLRYPVERMDVVELEPALFEASRWFEPENGRPLADPRTRPVAGDGRNVLLLSPARYDVIISQPSLPWVAGAATLFTQEFFEIASNRLTPDGVFGQWVTADAMGRESLRSVLSAFARVFPHFLVVEPTPGDLLLVGSQTRLALHPVRAETAFTDPTIADDLARVDIRSPRDLLVTVLGNDATIAPLLADAVPNRDENVYVEFSGPKAFAGILAGRRDDPLAWIRRDEAPLVWNALLVGGEP